MSSLNTCLPTCCVLRCPPAGPSFTSGTSGCTRSSSCAQNPLLSMGDTYHIPAFWTNNFSDFPGQEAGTNTLADDNWNSYTGDRISEISDLSRITKNSPKASGTYYVEYWYATLDQDPLVVDQSPYVIGDATATPQNIFTYWENQAGATGAETNPYSQVGTKFPMIFPNLVSYFQFTAYMCRFVMLAGTANPDDAQILYGLVFVPISDNNFFKIMETTDYSMTRTGQNLTSANLFNSFYSPAGINQAISQSTWDNIDPSTNGMNLNIISRINKFSETAFATVDGTGDTMHSHVVALDPTQWVDAPTTAYSLIPIISPQANLECFLTITKVASFNVVYRAINRGWMVLTGTETIPSLSNTFIYRVDPPYSSEGTGSIYCAEACCTTSCCCCTATCSTGCYNPCPVTSATTCTSCGETCNISRIIGISSTTSSTAGTNVITYQDVSAIDFFLMPCDQDGNMLDQDILNLLPRTITAYVDYSPNIPYSTVQPRYNYSYVFPEDDTIFGTSLQTLLLEGETRNSMNEGAQWSQWNNINLRDPYISDDNYVGTGTPESAPGSIVVFNAVTPNTLYCPGQTSTAANPDPTMSILNDYVEVSFPLSTSSS